MGFVFHTIGLGHSKWRTFSNMQKPSFGCSFAGGHELLVEVWYALVLTSNFALYLISKGTTVWTVFIFGNVPHHYMLCNSNEVLCKINYSWHQTVGFTWTKGTTVWTTYVVGIFLCRTRTVPSEENILWDEQQLMPDSNLSMIWKIFCFMHVVNILLHYTLFTVE